MKNRHLYLRPTGLALEYVGTVMARSDTEAAERGAEYPGKYVVIDYEKGTVTKVNVTLRGAAE